MRPLPCNAQSGASEVDVVIKALEQPLKAASQALRAIIAGISPTITEGIKWNVPSFRVKEYFATISIRADVVQVILHRGAKATAASKTGLTIDDPSDLLEWLGKERASKKFNDMKSVNANKDAFENILRQWIARLP